MQLMSYNYDRIHKLGIHVLVLFWACLYSLIRLQSRVVPRPPLKYFQRVPILGPPICVLCYSITLQIYPL
jgi:hypothetical protein